LKDVEMGDETREPQYNYCLEVKKKFGTTSLGLMTNQCYHDDPRRLPIMLSRYKFVSKMLSGCNKAVEIGCGDGFASRIVRQEVKELTLTDFDPVFIQEVQANNKNARWNVDCRVHDMLSGPIPGGPYDAAYSLDVLEHIQPTDENLFLANAVRSLTPQGCAIFGMPSLQSQSYASKLSKEGHVNCKDGGEFKKVFQRFFHNVFVFSMNDEVVHTGFYPMAHYLLALGCNPKLPVPG